MAQFQKEDPIEFSCGSKAVNKMRLQLALYGVCVLKNVLNETQVNKALDLTWSALTEMSPALDRNRPATWTTENRPDDQSGMIQSMAGWTKAQMYTRRRTTRVFAALYDTHKLDCSVDGMTFSGILKNRRSTPSKRVHFDAGINQTEPCVQGVLNLIDQSEGDACFGCYPSSHLYHSELVTTKKNWSLLSDSDRAYLEGQGLSFTRFTLKAGDMLLFRSQLAHNQAHPININVQTPRIVHYICMMPVCKDAKKRRKTIDMKRKAYEENRATTHYPNYELTDMRLFPKQLGNGTVARYRRDVSKFKKAKKIALDEMSTTEKRLMGFVPYE